MKHKLSVLGVTVPHAVATGVTDYVKLPGHFKTQGSSVGSRNFSCDGPRSGNKRYCTQTKDEPNFLHF